MFSGARSGCVLRRWRTRSTTTVVLPVPAPARTMSGPSPHSTAELCSGVSWIPVSPTADSLSAITITAKAKGSPCHLARHEAEPKGVHAPDARLVRREPRWRAPPARQPRFHAPDALTDGSERSRGPDSEVGDPSADKSCVG